ncbi:IMP cyclohydrolase / Phosphoribosylaminoimidazolecarboxamide formyltransferase, partial [hydrothermal vent metagenome]
MTQNRVPIRRVLISVSDKTNIEMLASGLSRLGVEILSTGGTAKMLEQAGMVVTEISEYTEFPEMMDGRIK